MQEVPGGEEIVRAKPSKDGLTIVLFFWDVDICSQVLYTGFYEDVERSLIRN